LQRLHRGSPADLIRAVYSEHKFLPWKFNSVPKNYWSKVENRRNYLEWIKTENKWTHLEDFYKLEMTFLQETSPSLVNHINLIQLVKSAYPNHNWEPWKFSKVPNGYWESEANQRNFILQIASQEKRAVTQLVDSDLIFNGGMNGPRADVVLSIIMGLLNCCRTNFIENVWIFCGNVKEIVPADEI